LDDCRPRQRRRRCIGSEAGRIILTALIAVAAVGNLNLMVTNVALPQIG
jgi:hypothetical protein